MTRDENAAPAERYGDLASLHVAHLDMLARQTPSKGQTVLLDADEAQAFLKRAQATGAVLADPEERAIAQRIIDYWSADLLSSERSLAPDAEMVTLAPFAQESEDPFFASSEVRAAVPWSGTVDTAFPAPPDGQRAPPAAPLQRPGSVMSGRPAPVEQPGSTQPAPRRPEGYTQDEARQYIRVASVARQWRDSQSDAYLLTSEALDNARQFKRDPDIARLIEASVEAERRVEKHRSRIKTRVIWALAVVMVVLIGLSYVAWDAAGNARTQAALAAEQAALAEEQAALAEDERAEAEALAMEASRRTEELTRANEQLDALAESREAQRRAADSRLTELEARQRLLDVAITVLAQSLVTSSTALDDIPPEIREEVMASLAARIRSDRIPLFTLASDVADAVRPLLQDMTFTAFERPLAGFQGGLPEPSPVASVLPGLHDALRATAHAQGAPVPYLNYSVVLDGQRRYAVYAAASLDRIQRTVLPAGPVYYDLDPRLPAEVQPDPGQYLEFLREGLEIVELVGRNEIAWGPEGSDAALVDRMVQVYPNTVPVPPAIKAGWDAVSAWVQTGHNPGASRVAIISGPVIPADSADGAPPVALWKIAISVLDMPQKQSAGPGVLIVDAFLVFDGIGSGSSDPEHHRTTVDEIAWRTGLIFPPEVVAVDQGIMLLNLTEGDRLADAVPGLDGPDAADRRALAQQLVEAVRDGGIGIEDQAKVVAALIDSLQNVRDLSATGRLNVIFVLSQVSRSNWDRSAWVSLKAACRRAVANLEAHESAGETRIGTDTRGHLDLLKTALGLDERPRQTVYLQFDGLTRERARNLRSALGALGWNLPGEERVATASGLKQVRYNPGNAADEAAARLLAADIVALGWTGTKAVPVSVIRPGILEIWVGNPQTP